MQENNSRPAASQIQNRGRDPFDVRRVRSAHVNSAGRVFRSRAVLVITSDGARLVTPSAPHGWTPGTPIPPGAQPCALSALIRHAEHAATKGVYASEPERKRAA